MRFTFIERHDNQFTWDRKNFNLTTIARCHLDTTDWIGFSFGNYAACMLDRAIVQIRPRLPRQSKVIQHGASLFFANWPALPIYYHPAFLNVWLTTAKNASMFIADWLLPWGKAQQCTPMSHPGIYVPGSSSLLPSSSGRLNNRWECSIWSHHHSPS